MNNLLISLLGMPANIVRTVLISAGVLNMATADQVVTTITGINSLELLATYMGVAAIQFVVVWAKRRFGTTG